MYWKKLLRFVLPFTLMATLMACSEEELTVENNDLVVSDNRPMIIAVARPDYDPLSLRDEKGLATGFNIDIMNAIAKDQDLKIEIVTDSFKNMAPGVGSGKYQISLTGETSNENMKKHGHFIDTVLKRRMALLVRSDSNIKTFEDAIGKRFTTQANTPMESELRSREWAGEVEPANTAYLGLMRVKENQSDALFVNAAVAMSLHKGRSSEYHLISVPVEYNPEGDMSFLVNKQRQDLIQKMNRGLANILANGEYDKIYRQWIGDDMWLKPTKPSPDTPIASETQMTNETRIASEAQLSGNM